MMFNILKLCEIFTISNRFEVSLMRLCNFWLDLAAAKTPEVQRVRYAKPRFRRYGYAFGHEPS